MNWLLLKNSLFVAALTTLLAVSLGSIAALWLAGLEKKWRFRLLALAVIALALPPFLVANCWLDLLGSTGVWRRWLHFNIISLGGTAWILSVWLWPVPLLLVLSAFQRLEPAQLESDIAVRGWAMVRALLLPLARQSILQAAVITFILALNNFAVPAILQVKVFPAEIWVRFTATFDTWGALGLSWPLVFVPLLLLAWLGRREIPWPRLEGPISPKLFRQQLGNAWFFTSGLVTFALCVLAVCLPLLRLLSVERTWKELPGALAANPAALWHSFWFAAAAALLALILPLLFLVRRVAAGTSTSLSAATTGVANSQRPHSTRSSLIITPSTVLPILLWLPFLLPGVLLGIGLIHLFNHAWSAFFYQSAAIVILAFVIRYLALGWHGITHALSTVDPDLMDDARLNGATRWRLFRYVQWPQMAPSAAAVWYVIFLLCLWDVESLILIVPPDGETLALRIFNLLHYGHNAQVNALCLTLLALAVAPLLAIAIWSGIRARPPAVRPHGTRITEHESRNTKHTTRLAFLALLIPFALLLASCTPNSGAKERLLPSQLFTRVQVIGSRGVGVGELNKPRSVAVDKQDNVYAVDMTGRVQKFSPEGTFLLSWQMPQTDLGKPKGMGRDSDGNIIVVEPHYQRVNHYSTNGHLVRQWGEKGTNVGQFIMPRAVAVNSHGEIYVSEYGVVERVQRFAAGKFVSSFGHAGTGPGEFNRPEGLCVDKQDRLYVADSCNHRIQIFSRDGNFIRAYGSPGTGKGQFSYPYDICVDASGRQYVCEFGNSRIQVFDASDKSLEIIGGPGADPGRFNNPWGVALDSLGNLYVADSQNHRLQKLVGRAILSAPHVAQVISVGHIVPSSLPSLDSGLRTWGFTPRTFP